MTSKDHPFPSLESCRIETADGLCLDGELFRPEQAMPNMPFDACLLVHGTGSHFRAEGVLAAFASGMLTSGTPVLRMNTRGHGRVASIPIVGGGTRNGGAAYEVIDECRLDIAAWLDFLVVRGFTRIALVGHSMGAVKAIYSQAREPHPNVRLIVAISPPRFYHANFMTHPDAGPFRADFERATKLVAKGRGEELITVKQPLPLELTAAGFLAKYGPHDDYDIVRHLPSVKVPTLVMVGEKSVQSSPAFDRLPDSLAQLALRQSSLTFRLVEGADTNYHERLDMPAQIVAEWLALV